ncbi:MAG TPA: L,D-transpeptidase family protein, partial [Flavisolibacter sp.]
NLIRYASMHPEHINRNNLYYMVPAKKQDPLQLADSLLNKQKDSAQYASNKMYGQLKSQLSVYYNIAKNGGWSTISFVKGLKKGSSSPAVMAIKKRLHATGEYPGSDTTQVFNDSLLTAIKTYQSRHGLKPTGIVDDSLINQMNITVEERIEQIIVNMNRSLWMPPQKDSSNITVNIPSQMLYVYADSGKILEMPVIVGKEGSGTVMFSSEINRIVFNPTWNIPESIVKNEIMPKMKSDATYLKKNNMEIVSQNDSIPVIRQLPGKGNPLGKVKFMFPNSHDIYLHDTPDKNAFTKNDRALSHGCIRVANANQLAEYLLQGEAGWNAQKISSAMNSGKEQTVELKTLHPVSITYLTAWVDESGMMNFRPDIYGHDREARTRMFPGSSAPVTAGR